MSNGKLAPRHRRKALSVLNRGQLAELTEALELEVEDRRAGDSHIDAIIQSRRVDFRDVLERLMRADLKAMCEELGLESGGREKELLIRRILTRGESDKKAVRTNSKRKASQASEATEAVAEPLPQPPEVPELTQSAAASWGIATPIRAGQNEPLRLRTDGACITETLLQLEQGFGGKPIPRDILERIRAQSEDLLSDILRSYNASVRSGEVGANGSAVASEDPPKAGACPTGLLYGRIQSGKTNAMIVTSALAIDNGFRVIVVFTSNFVKLVEQTVSRFRALDGPLIYASTEAGGGSYQWEEDLGNIQKNIASKGLVLICAKDSSHQRALLDLLKEAGAPDYPTLIFDDEADQASPDTTQAARSKQRASAPAHGSTTFRLTYLNDAELELGESTREILRHNLFLQVTATPFALLLQNIDQPTRPEFTRILEPGLGYTGGEHFFSGEQVASSKPPIVFVDEEEVDELKDGGDEIPVGLQRAIAYFLVAATAYELVSHERSPEGYKLLCHSSPKTREHDKAGVFIREFIDELSDQFTGEESKVIRKLFEWADGELRRTFPHAPPLRSIKERIKKRLHLRKVLLINSAATRAEFGSAYNFMVGGNILGRGLTIENLLVTYYLRKAKTTQMDTMLQHARMYGYRKKLMPYTRVFLPESLANRFNRIHETETTLRDLLKNSGAQRIPVKVANKLRATRRGVLDVNAIGAYRPGQQVYPTQPAYTEQALGDSTVRIDQILELEYGDSIEHKEFMPIDVARMREIIAMSRTEDEELGDWDHAALDTVLMSMADDCGGRGYLYIREFRPERGPILSTGAISGDEHRRARGLGKPVLFLFKQVNAGPPWAGVTFWYPTVVFPGDMPMQVFNTTG